MRKIHSIIIHHTAGRQDASAASIDKAHKRRKWRGIGYHRVITKHGGAWHCENGRDLNKQGAHAGAFKNRGSIGLTVCGNYVETQPPLEAIKVLYNEIYHLNENLQSQGPNPCEPLPIYGHCDLKATACPGNDLYYYIPSIRIELAAGTRPDDFIPYKRPHPLAIDRTEALANLKTYKQWTRT